MGIQNIHKLVMEGELFLSIESKLYDVNKHVRTCTPVI